MSWNQSEDDDNGRVNGEDTMSELIRLSRSGFRGNNNNSENYDKNSSGGRRRSRKRYNDEEEADEDIDERPNKRRKVEKEKIHVPKHTYFGTMLEADEREASEEKILFNSKLLAKLENGKCKICDLASTTNDSELYNALGIYDRLYGSRSDAKIAYLVAAKFNTTCYKANKNDPSATVVTEPWSAPEVLYHFRNHTNNAVAMLWLNIKFLQRSLDKLRYGKVWCVHYIDGEEQSDLVMNGESAGIYLKMCKELRDLIKQVQTLQNPKGGGGGSGFVPGSNNSGGEQSSSKKGESTRHASGPTPPNANVGGGDGGKHSRLYF